MPGEGPSDRLAATREIAGTGALALVLQEAMEETGRTKEDLMVMSDNDQYRIDTAGRRGDAQWFAEQVERFVAPGRLIHVRGVFYACVAAPAVKPDGTAFVNDALHEKWLGETARHARWLGYVDFERLVDNKNDEPVWRDPPEEADPRAMALAYGLDIDGLNPDEIEIRAHLAGFPLRQRYFLFFWGEKTSLEDVVAPLAKEFGAGLCITGGQISDTLLYRIAKAALDDGRRLILFTLSDCDPAGYWDMPTVIGRKLQALRDLLFPDLEYTLVPIGLSPDQARTLDLPSSPLKEGEKRGALWLETYGLEQTEIDALATLRPDALEEIIRTAVVGPYFDPDLAQKVKDAKDDWEAKAQDEIDEQIDGERLDALKERAQAALDELAAVNAEVEAMRDDIEIEEPVPDLPEADMDVLSEAQEERRDAVLIDSDMDYVEATDRLRAHNELAARREASAARKAEKVRRKG
jgi:hypothetical protein